MTARSSRRRGHWQQTGAFVATGLLATAVASVGGPSAGSSGVSASATARIYACYSDKTSELTYLDEAKSTTCPTGETRISWSAQGPQGANGAEGRTGAQGAQGATGTTGARGRPGSQGAPGAQGNRGGQGTAGPQGAAGAQGPQGAQGSRGARGAQGPTGLTGPQGSGAKGKTGAVGARGATGPQGAVGAQGDTGAPGAAAFNHTWTLENTAVQPKTGEYPKSRSESVTSLDPASSGTFSGATYQFTATVAGAAFPKASSVTTLSCIAGLQTEFSPSGPLSSPTPPARAAAKYGNFGMVQLVGSVDTSSSKPTVQVRCKVDGASWHASDVTLTVTELHPDFGPDHAHHVRRTQRPLTGEAAAVGPRNQFAPPGRRPKGRS
jgi:hypothetical protein